MGTILTFVTGVWNAVVAVAPIVIHAVCEIVDKSSKAITF